MKYNRKIINMDYRNQTTATVGIFAEVHWPRDDETTEHNLHRLDRRAEYARTQRMHDAPVREYDQNDINIKYSASGRTLM